MDKTPKLMEFTYSLNYCLIVSVVDEIHVIQENKFTKCKCCGNLVFSAKGIGFKWNGFQLVGQ